MFNCAFPPVLVHKVATRASIAVAGATASVGPLPQVWLLLVQPAMHGFRGVSMKEVKATFALVNTLSLACSGCLRRPMRQQ